MKKTYIILVGIMILVFPGVVNAMEFESCPDKIKVDEEVTLKLKDYTGDESKLTWTSTSTDNATVNPKTDKKEAIVKGVKVSTGDVSITVAEEGGDSVSCEFKVISNKSTDATLKSLEVEGFTLSPEFDKDTEKYTVKVKKDTTEVKITGEATDGEKATVEGLGDITLDKDNMTAKVTVTAEDETTTKTYTIKFEVEEVVEIKDFTLKSLTIEGGKIDPKFSKDVTEYTLTIDDIKKLDVSAEATDPNARIIISSYEKLSTIEKNGITITVPNSDTSKSKKYKLSLPVKEYNVNLSKLELVAYPFEEAFEKDVTRYTATIPYEVEEVTLTAIAEDSNATVTHTSLKNLKVGNNQITVTVKNGDKSKNYLIIVTRSEEEELEEKATSIITTGKDKNSKNSDYDLPDVDDPDSTLNLITVTLASIILFTAGVIGIIFFIRTSPKRLKKEVFSKHEVKKSSPLVEAKAKETNELDNE